MPNQEMLDRMPEVSRETLAEALRIPVKTLADQVGAIQQGIDHEGCRQRTATLEAEKATLAKALHLTYQTHQDIHPCTLCAQMWRKLEELAALAGGEEK